jgi:hypothetical protein
MLWAVLLIALVLVLLGFIGSALKVLLWLGVILLVLWALGWVIRPGAGTGTGTRRWYYW